MDRVTSRGDALLGESAVLQRLWGEKNGLSAQTCRMNGPHNRGVRFEGGCQEAAGGVMVRNQEDKAKPGPVECYHLLVASLKYLDSVPWCP